MAYIALAPQPPHTTPLTFRLMAYIFLAPDPSHTMPFTPSVPLFLSSKSRHHASRHMGVLSRVSNPSAATVQTRVPGTSAPAATSRTAAPPNRSPSFLSPVKRHNSIFEDPNISRQPSHIVVQPVAYVFMAARCHAAYGLSTFDRTLSCSQWPIYLWPHVVMQPMAYLLMASRCPVTAQRVCRVGRSEHGCCFFDFSGCQLRRVSWVPCDSGHVP